MGSDQQFCLRWHNYQSSLMASLPQFLDNDNLTDVTLSAGGRNIRAHKVVLSACSQYFNELFKVLQPMEHPVIVVPGTSFPDLCALVTFMYSGEVNIYQEQLQGLLSMADAMQIRGLAEVSGTGKTVTTSSKKENNATSKRSRYSTQPTSTLSNVGLENNNTKCSAKPLQTETVDNCSQYTKEKLDSEVYAGMSRTTESIHQNEYESGLQIGNSHKMETGCSGQFCNNFEQLTDNVKSRLMSRTPLLNESEVLQLKDSSSNMFNVSPTQEPKIKTENDSSNIIEMSEKDIRPSLRRSVISSSEAKKKYIADSDIQGQISPESDDSSGNNFLSENMQVNQVLPVTALKLKSPFYGNKQLVPNLAASCNSKLYATCFVCGKQLSNQYNLRVHLETHQNINYACNVCSHISRSRDALRKHVSYRHPGEGRERIGFGNITKEARLTIGNSYAAPTKKPKVIDNNNENKHTDT